MTLKRVETHIVSAVGLRLPLALPPAIFPEVPIRLGSPSGSQNPCGAQGALCLWAQTFILVQGLDISGISWGFNLRDG